jgi:hypothetical protein
VRAITVACRSFSVMVERGEIGKRCSSASQPSLVMLV